MTVRLAYDAIEISHGGNTVPLRPCLLAGLLIAQRYTMPDLFDHLEQTNITALRYLIALGCDDYRRTDDFMAAVSKDGLVNFRAFTPALAEFIMISLGLDYEPDEKTPTKSATTAKPRTHVENLTDLFEFATGWLGWTPGAAWAAIPAEILVARNGRYAMLRAIHGDGSETPDKTSAVYSADELKRVEELGHDPAFERDKLKALNARLAAGA
jgi:hypothetical protein